MNKLFFAMVLVSGSANAAPITLHGAAATKMFDALIQADLKTVDTTAVDGENFETMIDQKVSVTDLHCELSVAAMAGVNLGTCKGVDMNGAPFLLGSAASAAILSALPSDGFGDGSTGHYTGFAKSISCEADASEPDPKTGAASAVCILIPQAK